MYKIISTAHHVLACPKLYPMLPAKDRSCLVAPEDKGTVLFNFKRKTLGRKGGRWEREKELGKEEGRVEGGRKEGRKGGRYISTVHAYSIAQT